MSTPNEDKKARPRVIPIIPQPRQVIVPSGGGGGCFVLSPSTVILSTGLSTNEAMLLFEYIKDRTGFDLSIREDASAEASLSESSRIELLIDKTNDNDRDESYELSATPTLIKIIARHGSGQLYGIQTLRQLLHKNSEWVIPCVTIEDAPRFPWRGLHLDVGRHFHPVASVKRFIDLMVLYKYNVFHWHLTEDQGWRIPIQKYPLLASISSKRDGTPMLHDREKLDGVPYGGYYTRDEIKQVVEYASTRHISIIPEIEMPGHTVAVLAAYPHLGCIKKNYKVRSRWGIEEDVFCAGNDDTFSFLQDVLSEVMEMFPGEFIHVGGDECPKTRWRECPKCQQRKKDEGLEDEKQLQSYFIRRIERFLNSCGKRLIGWDEILEGGLAPNAAVMSWRGTEGGIEAAKIGHDVVMTPTSHCYLDYYQAKDTAKEPPAIGGFLSLSKAYEFDPTEGVPAEGRKYILGGQGNVWTEYIPTMEQVEYMTYPRACALAESLWSMPERRHFRDFCDRLELHCDLLDSLGVNYRRRMKFDEDA